MNKQFFRDTATVCMNLGDFRLNNMPDTADWLTAGINQPYCIEKADYRLNYFNGKWISAYNLNRHQKCMSLCIYSSEREIHLDETLKLLWYALNHTSKVSENQVGYVMYENILDTTLFFLPIETADSILTLKFPELDSFLSSRFYLHPGFTHEWKWNIGYYFQSGAFHFYKRNSPIQNLDSVSLKSIEMDTAGTALFSVRHLQDVVAANPDDYLIKANDTYYLYSLKNQSALTPILFHLPSQYEISKITRKHEQIRIQLAFWNDRIGELVYNMNSKVLSIDRTSIESWFIEYLARTETLEIKKTLASPKGKVSADAIWTLFGLCIAFLFVIRFFWKS